MLTRFAAYLVLACLCVSAFAVGPAAAANNEQEVAQLRIYIQQLEERVRQLTGENERLTHQVQQLSAAGGVAPQVQGGLQGGTPGVAAGHQAPVASAAPVGIPQVADTSGGANDPMTIPDAAPVPTGPVDLTTLADGQNPPVFSENAVPGDSLSAPGAGKGTQTTLLSPPLTGNAREEYDAAYGYILTGDYGAAEGRFRTWLAAFPKDPQAPDAQFWLGESYYQEGKAREAATTFLNLHNTAPQSPKAADVLVRLGMSLAKLGEKDAACATLAEVGKRYPGAAKPVQQRVAEELKRNAC